MWRFIFIVTIFISAFFPFTGDAHSEEEYENARYTCAEGFWQFGQFCQEVIHSYEDCPPVEANNNQCAQTVFCTSVDARGSILRTPASRQCWHGSRSQGDKCIENLKDDLGPAEVKCEPGFDLTNGECTLEYGVWYVCTGGRTQQCQDQSYYTRGPCPKGYYVSKKSWYPEGNHYCIWDGKNEQLCNSGGTLIDGKCYRTSPKRFYCPKGKLKNNRCEETIQRQRQNYFCPDYFVTFRCTRPRPGTTVCDEVSPVRICPAGYDLLADSGLCLSRTQVAAVLLS